MTMARVKTSISASILALMLTMLVSCDPIFPCNLHAYTENSEDLVTAWKYVSSFKYIPDPDGYKYWKSYTEFVNAGGGDCNDFAAALCYLLGEKSELVVIATPDGINHAIVCYNGACIEPQEYGKYYVESSLSIIATYSYHEVMQHSTYYGLKSIAN